jgi:hypothetical protein
MHNVGEVVALGAFAFACVATVQVYRADSTVEVYRLSTGRGGKIRRHLPDSSLVHLLSWRGPCVVCSVAIHCGVHIVHIGAPRSAGKETNVSLSRRSSTSVVECCVARRGATQNGCHQVAPQCVRRHRRPPPPSPPTRVRSAGARGAGQAASGPGMHYMEATDAISRPDRLELTTPTSLPLVI